jgi:hypothetical protein
MKEAWKAEGTDGRTALKWIFRKLDGRVCAMCCCEYCNKSSDSIKGRDFIEQLSNYQQLKEGLCYKVLLTQFLQS